MSHLETWNGLPEAEALSIILACCGSVRFAAAMVESRPVLSINELLAGADSIWWSLEESDWLEAFGCHPRIGEASSHSSRQFSAWSTEEQSKTRTAEALILEALAVKNREYETRHGFLYIVCASGRSAEELLAILERRLGNSTATEIREAAEQQRQITNLRLRRWFTP